MKFNCVELRKILKPWIDFDEGETGDCPELGEILGKVVEHERGFVMELRAKLHGNKPYGPSPMQKELIEEILGVGDKTKENVEQ